MQKAIVQGAISIEPCNVIAALVIDFGEEASNEHLVIALHHDRKDEAVGSGESVLKAAVQSAVRIQPRNIGAAHAIDCGEGTSDEHLVVALQRDGKNHAVASENFGDEG